MNEHVRQYHLLYKEQRRTVDGLCALISTLTYTQSHDEMMSQEVEFWLCSRHFVSRDLGMAGDSFDDAG